MPVRKAVSVLIDYARRIEVGRADDSSAFHSPLQFRHALEVHDLHLMPQAREGGSLVGDDSFHPADDGRFGIVDEGDAHDGAP
jgi:hypothetical protein